MGVGQGGPNTVCEHLPSRGSLLGIFYNTCLKISSFIF